MKNSKTNPNKLKPYLHAFYERNRLRFAGTLLLTLMDVPINLIVSWLLGAIIDAIPKGAGALLRLLCIALLLTVFAGACTLLLVKVRSDFMYRAVSQYKALAFERLSEKSIAAFSRENTGRYISLLTNDVTTVEQGYLLNIPVVITQTALFIASLVMMFCLSVPLALASIALSILPLAVSLLTGKPLQAREKAVSDQNESFVAQVKDLLSGFSVIKSMKAEREVRTLFGEANHAAEEQKRLRRVWRGVIQDAAQVSGLITQFGIFLFGAVLAARGNITGGTVIIFVQMAGYLIGPINYVPQYIAEIRAARGLIGKLADLAEENVERSGDAIEPVLHDAIELRDVSFAYEPENPVLQNVSFRLEAGKKYALVGASGSGKSTLLNLLMGAYNGYEGSLTVDGKELRSVGPDSLYDLMSLIGQNVFLFDDTVERNITMFKDFPAERLRSAEERSGLAKLIAEKGSDYRCGENGVNLSGGERQRVSIARCLLRGTPVLLLDEATASLDNETAFAVTSAILDLEGLTRLVVTHRLDAALLSRYDGVLVLRNGRLAEEGDFATLMERKGYFYSLYTVTNG